MASMKKVRTVSKNAAALTTAKLINSSLTLLLAIAINRKLGPANAGIYNLALAVYMMLGIIPDFGIGYITIRDCSQDRSRLPEYLPKVIAIRMFIALGVASLIMLGNVAGYAASSGPDAAVRFWTIAAISLSLFVEMPLTNTMSEALSAVDQFTFIALVNLNMSILKIGLSIYVLVAGIGQPLVLLMLAYVLTQAYGAAHLYLHYRRKGFHVKQPHKERAHAEESLAETGDRPLGTRSGHTAQPGSLGRYLLGSSWPIAIVFVSLAVYSLIDTPLLFFMKGDAQVGLYSAAYMFARSFFFLITTLNLVALPIVARVYQRSPDNLGNLWEQLMRHGMLLVVPLCLVVPLLGRPILILQQHDFITAMPALWLTMAAAVFFFMSSLMYPFFVTINSQRLLTTVVLRGVVVKVLLNLALVPLLGFKGTAIAMLISEIVLFLMLYFSLSRKLGYRIRPVRFGGVPAVTALGLYAALYLSARNLMTGAGTVPGLLQALAAGAVISAAVLLIYSCVILATRQISRSGLHKFNELLEAGMQAAEPSEPAPLETGTTPL